MQQQIFILNYCTSVFWIQKKSSAMCLIWRGTHEAKKGACLGLWKLTPFKIIQHALPAPIPKVEACIYIVYNSIRRLLVTIIYPWRLSGQFLLLRSIVFKEQRASLICKHGSQTNWKNQITCSKAPCSFPVFHGKKAPKFPFLHGLFNKGFLSPWTEHPCWQKFLFPGAAIVHSY